MAKHRRVGKDVDALASSLAKVKVKNKKKKVRKKKRA